MRRRERKGLERFKPTFTKPKRAERERDMSKVANDAELARMRTVGVEMSKLWNTCVMLREKANAIEKTNKSGAKQLRDEALMFEDKFRGMSKCAEMLGYTVSMKKTSPSGSFRQFTLRRKGNEVR